MMIQTSTRLKKMYKLLNFDKPEKVKIDAGFEGGPDGGYVPQMSQEDAMSWKAKKFNIGKENARIELRKSYRPTQVFIIVALDGWDLAKKYESREKSDDQKVFQTITKGLNVRMSMNGPLLLTFDKWQEIHDIVEEAKYYLKEHES